MTITFDRHEAPLTFATTELVWRCANCGYQRLDTVSPTACPQCRASAGAFEGRTAIAWRLALATPRG